MQLIHVKGLVIMNDGCERNCLYVCVGGGIEEPVIWNCLG